MSLGDCAYCDVCGLQSLVAVKRWLSSRLEIVIPAAHIFRWVTTEEIAEAVALLVSDRGKFIADVIYRVDGGMTGA